MTTNQTIDGVPRHWAEIEAAIWGAFADGAKDYKGCTRERLRELRALLNAPACKMCGDSGWVPEPFSIRENVLECPECKPAAKPQGEPVAYVDYSASGGVRWRPWEHGNLADGAPLFSGPSEQPGPVAVLMP